MADLFTLPVSVRQALKAITGTLENIYPREEAKAIAWLLIEHELQAQRVRLLTRQEAPLTSQQAYNLTKNIQRLLQHEPVQYVVGETEFFGLKLKVAPGVLIPRPETEELAELIIAENKKRKSLKVLDIGTGSGCLALALKSELAGAEVHALDISEDALQIAKSNAAAHNFEIMFYQADILNAQAENLPENLDIIVSNPPYVLQSDEEEMLPNVLVFEPHSALFVPDSDPLLFYTAISNFAEKHLATGGRLYFETHYKYAGDIAEDLKSRGFTKVKPVEDMFGKPRFVSACYKCN